MNSVQQNSGLNLSRNSLGNMDSEEKLVFDHIRNAGNEGQSARDNGDELGPCR